MIKEIVDGIFNKVTGFFKPVTDMVVNGYNYVTNFISNIGTTISNFLTGFNPLNLIAGVMMTGMMKFGEMTSFMMKMLSRPAKWKHSKQDESKSIDDRLNKLNSNEINLKNQKSKDDKTTISNKKEDKNVKVDPLAKDLKSLHDDKMDSIKDEKGRLTLQKSAIQSELDSEPEMGKTMGEVASFGKVMFDAIGKWIKPIFDKFTGWVGGLFGGGKASEAVTGALDTVGTTTGKVVGAVGAKTVDIAGASVKGIGDDLVKAGTNAISNTKDALTSTEAGLGAKAGVKVASVGYDAITGKQYTQDDVNKIIPAGFYDPQKSVMAKGFNKSNKPIEIKNTDNKSNSQTQQAQQAPTQNTGNKVNIVVNQGDTSVVNAIQPGKNPSSRKQ